MLWALEEAPVGEAVDVLILLAYANHANEHGISWPSIKRVSKTARCSRATLYRRLDKLREAGLMERVDETETPSGWLRIRQDRRPTAYRLRVDRSASGSHDETRRDPDSVSQIETDDEPRGLTGETHGVSLVRHEPRTEPRTDTSPLVVMSPNARARANDESWRVVDNRTDEERRKDYREGYAKAMQALAEARQAREQAQNEDTP